MHSAKWLQINKSTPITSWWLMAFSVAALLPYFGSHASESVRAENLQVWSGVVSVPEDTGLCSSGEGGVCSQFDCIVILGGGPQGSDGLPPEWTRRRLDAALALDRCCTGGRDKESTLKFITTSLGSAHVPNALDSNGFPISEAQASAAYLMSAGIHPARIFLESASWDTIGNAFFVRQMHTDVRGWNRLLVITSDFHLERSRAIFEWIFRLPRVRGSVIGDLAYSQKGKNLVREEEQMPEESKVRDSAYSSEESKVRDSAYSSEESKVRDSAYSSEESKVRDSAYSSEESKVRDSAYSSEESKVRDSAYSSEESKVRDSAYSSEESKVRNSAYFALADEARDAAYFLAYLGVSDEGIAMAQQRKEREAQSCANVHGLASRLTSMPEVHEWMYSNHDAYAAGATIKRLQGQDRVMYGG